MCILKYGGLIYVDLPHLIIWLLIYVDLPHLLIWLEACVLEQCIYIHLYTLGTTLTCGVCSWTVCTHMWVVYNLNYRGILQKTRWEYSVYTRVGCIQLTPQRDTAEDKVGIQCVHPCGLYTTYPIDPYCSRQPGQIRVYCTDYWMNKIQVTLK